jgi:hypothetical protein
MFIAYVYAIVMAYDVSWGVPDTHQFGRGEFQTPGSFAG